MKKILLCGFLILPLLLGGVVSAHSSEPHDSDRPVASTAAADNKPKKTSQQRIVERKSKSTRKFSPFELAFVKNNCAAANGLVKSAHARLGSFEAKRTKVYSGTVTRLQEFSPKLKAAGVDTTSFDEQVAVLNTKAEAYSDDIAALKLAADDMVATDCTEDQEGFVVTLLEAQALRESVIQKGQDFRTYLKDTIKPTLMQIREDVKAKGSQE